MIKIVLLAVAALLGAGKTLILFEDARVSSGIQFVLDNSVTSDKHQIETMIGGVAVFDYNNDGWLDIYFLNGSKLPEMDKRDPKYWNRLYRNNGNGKFTDVTGAAGLQGAGYGMGVAAGDYDNDGWVDLYVAGVDRNQLFHNNGNGSFSDRTATAAVTGVHPQLGKMFSVSAGWFDYDNDGWLDLLVVNYLRWNLQSEPKCKSGTLRAYCTPDQYDGQPSMLFHNNADGTFTDVSASSGIGKQIGKGMGVAFADYDNDGYVDVFISNDTYRNFLYHNNGNGTFSERGVLAGVAYNDAGKSIAGMGADFRDINNDGKPDIWVTGMTNDTFPLFLNTGTDFSDITESSAIAHATRRMTGWGAGLYDFDNDGWKDLFAAGGSVLDNQELVDRMPTKLPNLLLRNLNGTGFENVSALAGKDFRSARQHRGAAFGDFDNDGRIDIVVTCLNEPPEIWMNHSPAPNHWLTIKLEGTKSNREGLGTRIKLTSPAGSTQYNQATTSVGFSSSSDDRVHFGIGNAPLAASLELTWPSGRRQTLTNVKADQVLRVTEPR